MAASSGNALPGYAPTQARDVAVLMVIFTVEESQLRVILVQRSADPEAGRLSLPGGLLTEGESLDDAAVRKLQDETGVSDVYLEQLYTFWNLDGRDTVATAYFALVDSHQAQLARRDAWRAGWFPISGLPELAFSNNEVIQYAVERLQAKLDYTNVAYSLLPECFTLTQLQEVYEAILGRELDKRNFRKRMVTSGIIAPTGRVAGYGAHRPAQLYAFRERRPIVL